MWFPPFILVPHQTLLSTADTYWVKRVSIAFWPFVNGFSPTTFWPWVGLSLSLLHYSSHDKFYSILGKITSNVITSLSLSLATEW